MVRLKKGRFGKVGHILFMFLIFHLIFLFFYALSSSAFFALGLWNLYFRQFLVNSVGFIAFYLSAFWLFPAFISKRKFRTLALIALIMVTGLGELQFKIEAWYSDTHPSMSALPTLKTGNRAEGQPDKPPSDNHFVLISRLPEPFGVDVRAMANILLYMLLGTGYAYMLDWFIKDRQARLLEKEKIQSELALLRYQLNPHFLFNTINGIYYLAIIRSEKTEKALLELSNLLRYVLDDKEDWVPLEKEIAHLQQLVNLHLFRFPEEVTRLETKLPEEINAFQIAPLLLTTFAENAFKHGEPGTDQDPVRMELQVREGKLFYQVTNKFNPGKEKDPSHGIGLQNLRRRLRLLYPGQHQLSCEESGDHFIAQFQIDLKYDPEYSRR